MSARVTARDKPALQTRVRIANNLCPICWMPLGMGHERGGTRDRWSMAQIVFKGKPAFSVANPDGNSQTSRPVLGFGISDIIPHGAGAENYNKCHYVHYLQFGNMCDVRNLWFAEGIDNLSPMVLGNVDGAVLRDGLFPMVCEQKGIFSGAVERPLSVYLGGLRRLPCNWKVVNVLAVKLFRFFAGCQDCNQKMSLKKVLPVIFDLAFPELLAAPAPAPRASIRGRAGARPPSPPRRPSAERFFKAEEMIHYLMLSGVLGDGEEVHGDQFRVRDEWRRRTWPLRYIMMWCALQILFAMWMIEKTDPQIRHHRSYIYYGVMDFYASLWFYAMHCLGMPEGGVAFDSSTVKAEDDTFASTIKKHVGAGSVVLEFEEFHFYYMSALPIFKKCHGDAGDAAMGGVAPSLKDAQLNLSTMIFGEVWSISSRDDVVSRLEDIYSKMFATWRDYVQHISNLVHRNFQLEQGFRSNIVDFFASPSEIIAMRDERKDLLVTVNTFAQNMGRGWFWFHFKHITFNRIALESKQYEEYLREVRIQGEAPPSVFAAVRMWRKWYEELDQAVRNL